MDLSNIPAGSNFDELADWLLTVDSQFSPAELHAALAGALCGGLRLSRQQWAQFSFAVIGTAEQIAARYLDSAEAALGGLADTQLALLSDEELQFQPFLPDDDQPIEQRTAALGDWCRGFLGGFAEARVRHAEAAESFSDTVQEALRDISAISRASVDGDGDDGDDDILPDASDNILDDDFFDDEGLQSDAEGEAGDAESAERDYMEVVEYLRLAALTVFTEVGWVEMQELPSPAKDAAAAQVADLFSSPNTTRH